MPKVNIIDAESFGLSPAEKTFNILKSGTPDFAELNIQFVESFGYGLKEAFLNGVRLPAQNGSSLKASMIPFLKNGENKLIAVFNALQLFGQPLGQAQISASITYTGASIQEIPSPSQALDDLGNKIKKHIPTIVALVIAGAVGLSAVAFTTIKIAKLWRYQCFKQKYKINRIKRFSNCKIISK